MQGPPHAALLVDRGWETTAQFHPSVPPQPPPGPGRTGRGSAWSLPPHTPFQVALLETNPYLLALTIVVSIVHSVFEFLAFKNGERRPGTGSAAGVGGGQPQNPVPPPRAVPGGGGVTAGPEPPLGPCRVPN